MLDRIEMIKEFNALPEGSALVVVTDSSTITELVLHNDGEDTKLDVFKTAIDILLTENIVDYRVVTIGDNYILVNDKVTLLSEITIHTAG